MSDQTPDQPADQISEQPSEAELAAAHARLEAEVEARKAAEQAAEDPTLNTDKPLAGLVDRMTQILQARGLNPDEVMARRFHELYGEPNDDLRAHQAQVRVQAWRNDLRAAEHDALAHWTITDLDADQHAPTLTRYVRELAAATADSPVQVLNLILAGRVGPGKTSAAIAAGNAAADAGMTVRFVKHSTYLAWLRPDGAPDGLTAVQIRARVRRCDLLILDDLGADLLVDQASEYVQRETNELVGDRLTSGRATIYTTNVTSAELTTMLGERAMSRIGARAHAVRFDGPDRRKPVTW